MLLCFHLLESKTSMRRTLFDKFFLLSSMVENVLLKLHLGSLQSTSQLLQDLVEPVMYSVTQLMFHLIQMNQISRLFANFGCRYMH